MASVSKQKYSVTKLQDTYYLVTRTEKFFSSKISYDHVWYINGQWKGIGFHTSKDEELNINFVRFLNEPIRNTASHIRLLLSTPWMEDIVNYLHHLSPSFIMPGYSITLKDFWGTAKRKFQNLDIEYVGIKLGSIPFIEIIPTNAGTFNRYHIGITAEERDCLIDFVRLSYLVELPRLLKKTAFFFNNNLDILEDAKKLGYCN